MILLVSLLGVAGILRAAEEKLATLQVGSEVYSNVTVTSVTANDIYFTHSRGMGNAKIKNLPPELQRRFHFDPAKATAQQQVQASANALYAKQLKDDAEGVKDTGDEAPPHPVAAKSFLNQPSPTISAEKWLTPQLTNTSGKCVLLVLWGTWSVGCTNAIPMLNAWAAKFKSHLAIIGLSDESEAEVRRMTEPKIDFSVAIDTQHRASMLFGVQRIPHAVLVDPKGIVRFEGHPGYLDDRKLATLLARYAP